jgi:hypothetical protein
MLRLVQLRRISIDALKSQYSFPLFTFEAGNRAYLSLVDGTKAPNDPAVLGSVPVNKDVIPDDFDVNLVYHGKIMPFLNVLFIKCELCRKTARLYGPRSLQRRRSQRCLKFVRSCSSNLHLKALANHQKDGWLHVQDRRVFVAYGILTTSRPINY